jgi:hypothetical protein
MRLDAIEGVHCMYEMCKDIFSYTLNSRIPETARAHQAATTIQRAYRTHTARTAMARMLGAVHVLQRFARRVLWHIHSLALTYALI